MGRCKRFESRLAAVAVLAIALLAAGQSAADWKVYVSAGLGISGADTETDGHIHGFIEFHVRCIDGQLNRL